MRLTLVAALLALGLAQVPTSARADVVVRLTNGRAVVASSTAVVGTRTVMVGEGWRIAVPSRTIASVETVR